MSPEELVAYYRLEPIPREGGLFRRTWEGPELPRQKIPPAALSR